MQHILYLEMMNQEGMIINLLNRNLKINYLIVTDWF